MISLEHPIGLLRGLMIYRDHAEPNLFYYVPERPRLARNNGVPELFFAKYRRDITDNQSFEEGESLGGGLLSFTVDLGVDDSALQAIRGELADFADGDIRLVPIQFHSGSVRLSVMRDSDRKSVV